MARKITEIYDDLCRVKENMSELGVYVNNDAESLDTAKKLVNDVRTQSRVAVWRLWLWIVAVASWIIEKLQDAHEAKVNRLIAIDKPHSINWYKEQCFLFQLGHEIVWDGEIFKYPAIDEDARIIKYAAAVEGDNAIITKVLKENKEVLTQAETTAFESFWRKWKDAGVNIQIVSQPANLTNFKVKVYRNRNIVNEDNTLIANPDKNVFEDVIDAYCNDAEFNSIFDFNEIIMKVLEEPGIINMTISYLNVVGGEGIGDWRFIPSSGFTYIDWGSCTIEYIDSYE